jgi:lipoyl(octanoyl) transferase
VSEHIAAVQSEVSKLDVRLLGLVDYQTTLDLQRSLHQQLIDGRISDTLIVCSHNPVITCGTSTTDEHLLTSEDLLRARGIELHRVERGGSATYHGPEQVVCYPIIDLKRHRTDVDWYMRSLEEVIVQTLQDFGVLGRRIPGKTGVWLDDRSKIAFSGVRISRWCTRHGFSLNVLECSEPFKTINPCGLGDIRVISLSEVCSRPISLDDVSQRIVVHFSEIFGYGLRVP